MNRENTLKRICRSINPAIIILTCIIIIFVSSRRPEGMIKLSATTTREVNQPVRPGEAANVPNNQSPAAQLGANPSVSVVTQAAVKMGVLSCASRINQVVTALTGNNQSGVFIFPAKQLPDAHIFSASFELVRPDDSNLYASASFFPNQDAVYDTVEYVNMGCQEVEKSIFRNLKRVSVIKKNIILLDGGAVKVFLMPAGSGTVVIKKEVVQ